MYKSSEENCHAAFVWGICQDKGIGKGLHSLLDG